METQDHRNDIDPSAAIRFVVLLGIVSLLADITYEGARSITGPYLSLLGASATVVGIVAGCGELVGYALRLASGWLTDRTQRYWPIVLTGYAVNLLAVPLLALAGRWEIAALLIVMERTGKAVRAPARDAMLSHATSAMGRGWGFGLHEALDQIGAVTGPLVMTAVLAAGGSHRTGFAWLAVPAALALATLLAARSRYPRPQELEVKRVTLGAEGLGRAYWLLLAGAACVASGFADFPLIAYRLARESVVPAPWIPALYAAAMAADAGAALAIGRLFDRYGVRALHLTGLFAAAAPPLVFAGGAGAVVAGMVCWGVSLGAQESALRAAVAALAPARRRGMAYGVFHTAFGVAWLAGSALMGALYDHARPALIAFAVAAPLLSLPLLAAAGRCAEGERSRNTRSSE